jgi:predicted RNA-binding protein with TRAM domain
VKKIQMGYPLVTLLQRKLVRREGVRRMGVKRGEVRRMTVKRVGAKRESFKTTRMFGMKQSKKMGVVRMLEIKKLESQGDQSTKIPTCRGCENKC